MTDELTINNLEQGETYQVDGETITLTKNPEKYIKLTYKNPEDKNGAEQEKLYDLNSNINISRVENKNNSSNNEAKNVNKPKNFYDIINIIEPMINNYYKFPEGKIMKLIG